MLSETTFGTIDLLTSSNDSITSPGTIYSTGFTDPSNIRTGVPSDRHPVWHADSMHRPFFSTSVWCLARGTCQSFSLISLVSIGFPGFLVDD